MARVDFNELAQDARYHVSAAPAEDPDSRNARINRENARFYCALATVIIATVVLAVAFARTSDANVREWAKTLLNTIIGGAIAIALGAHANRSG